MGLEWRRFLVALGLAGAVTGALAGALEAGLTARRDQAASPGVAESRSFSEASGLLPAGEGPAGEPGGLSVVGEGAGPGIETVVVEEVVTVPAPPPALVPGRVRGARDEGEERKGEEHREEHEGEEEHREDD